MRSQPRGATPDSPASGISRPTSARAHPAELVSAATLAARSLCAARNGRDRLGPLRLGLAGVRVALSDVRRHGREYRIQAVALPGWLAWAAGVDLALLGAQARERDERDRQQHGRGQEHAVDAAPVGREPADQAADDLADGEEDRVEAHDRPAVGREALGDVGQQAERGGRRPGQHEQAGPGDHDGRDEDDERQVRRMVHDQAGTDQDRATDEPVRDDRRPAHRLEAIAPVQQAGPEDDRDEDRGDA